MLWFSLCLTSLIFVGISSFASPPDPGPTASASASTHPRMSPLGYKRVQENIAILNKNISDTQKNISASEQNIRTIELEWRELDKLEQEHKQLRVRYQEYLSQAREAVAKNEKSASRLEKWETELKSRGTASEGDIGRATEQEMLMREKGERQRWLQDTNNKINRTEELIRGVEKNIREIASRREPLRAQLKLWKDKQVEFQQLAADLAKRKSEYESYAKK